MPVLFTSFLVLIIIDCFYTFAKRLAKHTFPHFNDTLGESEHDFINHDILLTLIKGISEKWDSGLGTLTTRDPGHEIRDPEI